MGWIRCAIQQASPKRLPGFFSLFNSLILIYFFKYENHWDPCPRIFDTYYFSYSWGDLELDFACKGHLWSKHRCFQKTKACVNYTLKLDGLKKVDPTGVENLLILRCCLKYKLVFNLLRWTPRAWEAVNPLQLVFHFFYHQQNGEKAFLKSKISYF